MVYVHQEIVIIYFIYIYRLKNEKPSECYMLLNYWCVVVIYIENGTVLYSVPK